MRKTKQLLRSAIIVGVAVTLIPSIPATAGNSARRVSKAYDPPADWMFPAECGGNWGYPSGSMIRNPRVIFETRPGERFVDLTITDVNPTATVAALVNQTGDLSGEVICGQATLPISDSRPLHVWFFQRTGGPGASVATGGQIEANFYRRAAAPARTQGETTQVVHGRVLVPLGPARAGSATVNACGPLGATASWVAGEAGNGVFAFLLYVKPATRGVPFILFPDLLADLDITFVGSEGRTVFDNVSLRAERGTVPDGARYAFVCMTAGTPTDFTYIARAPK